MSNDLALIKRLEKELGIVLIEKPRAHIMLYGNRGYSLDISGFVTGINLHDCNISELFPLTLEKYIRLSHLYLGFNKISNVSNILLLKNLRKLDLRSNRISRLPCKIASLGMDINWERQAGGYGIYLAGNPLESPPVEIIKQGTQAVLNYFKELQKEKVKLMECKILIVGNGEVGKTSLMKKLMYPDQPLNKNESLTHGIHINSWPIKCPFADSNDDEAVNTHFWDFGGQAIYHATHQFFLTKRSLYLLVWDARREEDAPTFDFWLNIIKLLGGGSPVQVVMNKADVRIKHLDEAQLKNKFDNIDTYFQVSCETGDGIQSLTERIKTTLAGMPHLRDELPKVWVDIRNRLNQIAADADYITVGVYYQVCRKYGDSMNVEGADFLSDYLHDLGVILHFRQDPQLYDTVILNPEWATEAVYTLLDTNEIQKNKGRFRFGDLKRHWDSRKYPRAKHKELIRLMEKFELTFNIVGTDHYIVPEMLPSKQPPIHLEQYDGPDALRFEYRYEFMPPGIIGRFISRCYYLVEDECFWRNGVILKLEDSTALVISNAVDRKTTIAVTGSNPNELMTIIRHELDIIHRSLNMEKKTHYTERIPCNCTQCSETKKPYFYNYDVLNRRHRKGIGETDCEYSDESVSIPLLLKGYEAPVPPKPSELPAQIVSAAGHFMSISRSLRPYENCRNDLIALLLTVKGILVKDQSRTGLSETEKTTGSPDFKFINPDGDIVSIMEAFNLNSFDTNTINRHLTKLFKYDTLGNRQNFILVYAETDKLTELWKKYLAHLPDVEFPFPIIHLETNLDFSTPIDIKIARVTHNRNDCEALVYHIFVKVRGER
jgi:internalin A